MSVAVSAQRSRRWSLRTWLLAGVGAVVVTGGLGIGAMVWHMNYVPPGLDYSTTRLSENGVFQATIAPSAEPIPINQIHVWTLRVEAADGTPVEGATIAVDGDMPQHGHGLPTQPQVTQDLGDGNYLVEGMKFQMTGWWVVDFDIDSDGRSDQVRFNLMLK